MKKFTRFNVVMVFMLLLWSGGLPAQGHLNFNGSRHKIGFITGYGGRNASQLLDKNKTKNNYYYKVVFFQLQYYYSLLIKKSFGLEILFQPQYNVTEFKNSYYRSVDKTNGYEYGLNIGLLARMNAPGNLFSFYFSFSSGPHYIPEMPERQSGGFIFSSNVFLGMNVKLFKNLYLDIRPGFRHLSNLNFDLPNKGINNLVISGGVLYVFRPGKQ